MACTSLNDVSLKVINIAESHAAQAQVSKDNFTEIGKYINNNRCRIKALEDAGTGGTVTTTTIVNSVRNNMIKVADLETTHVNGVTVTQTNGLTVTRNGNNFVVQTPDSIPILLHSLRDKATKQFSSNYKVSMDGANQITIHFSPFIKQDLEFIIFG